MSKPPSFQWYPKDCDTDENVRAMDDREMGFYLRCLNHSWINDGLPSDLNELARVLGRSTEYVKRLWARVGRCFIESDGRFRNPKQEEQRRSQGEFAKSRRAAAKVRWEKKQESVQCIGDARALQVQCSASASASAEEPPPAPSDAKALPPAWSVDESYAPFTEAYRQAKPNVLDDELSEAHSLYRRLDFTQKLQAVDGVRKRLEYGVWDDPTFVPAPTRYLQREWRRDVIPRKAAGLPARETPETPTPDWMRGQPDAEA